MRCSRICTTGSCPGPTSACPWYLGGLSFAESSFFPIPPDVMLAPMSMAQPAKAWQFALLTTVTSVAGGLFGYLIGYFAFELIEPMVGPAVTTPMPSPMAEAWFDEWGVWVVFIAGFSPIPYKIFTITAGVWRWRCCPSCWPRRSGAARASFWWRR
jgi:membrane protein YqaA with SNARE-associated domain